jgi:hypothetical protein
VRATALGRTLRHRASDHERCHRSAPQRSNCRPARSATLRCSPRRKVCSPPKLVLDRTRPGGSHLGRSERARPCWRGRCPGIPRHRFNYRQPRSGGGTERRACRHGSTPGPPTCRRFCRPAQPRINAGDRIGLARKQRKRAQGCERGAVVRWIFGIGAADPGSGRNLVPRRPLSPRQAPPPEPPERANCAGYYAAGSVSSSVK